MQITQQLKAALSTIEGAVGPLVTAIESIDASARQLAGVPGDGKPAAAARKLGEALLEIQPAAWALQSALKGATAALGELVASMPRGAR